MTPTITPVGREAVDRFEPLWRALDDRVVGYRPEYWKRVRIGSGTAIRRGRR